MGMGEDELYASYAAVESSGVSETEAISNVGSCLLQYFQKVICDSELNKMNGCFPKIIFDSAIHAASNETNEKFIWLSLLWP